MIVTQEAIALISQEKLIPILLFIILPSFIGALYAVSKSDVKSSGIKILFDLTLGTLVGTFLGFHLSSEVGLSVSLTALVSLIAGTMGSVVLDLMLKLLPDLITLTLNYYLQTKINKRLSLFKTETYEKNNTEIDKKDK